MNIGLIAHDTKKADMIMFCMKYQQIFQKYNLFATGTTGELIRQATGLDVHCFLSGPLGGDQQIGSKVAHKELGMLIFFRDPLTAMPHEPDVSALLRLCDVHNIPIATNMATASILLKDLERRDVKITINAKSISA